MTLFDVIVLGWLVFIGGMIGIAKHLRTLDDNDDVMLRHAFSEFVIGAGFSLCATAVFLFYDKAELNLLIVIGVGAFLSYSGTDILKRFIEKKLQLKNDKTNIGNSK